MPGDEWRADPVPGETERARDEVPATPEISFDETAFAARAVLPAPTATASLVLAPGEPAGLLPDAHRHHGDHLIVLSDVEVVLVNELHRYRCARPGHDHPGGPPLLDRIVSVYVHHRAVGALDKGHRFVYAIGVDDRLLGTVDLSDTPPLRQSHLEAMCAIAGVRHEMQVFETVGALVAACPAWAAPDLEFEVDHAGQEVAREWAEFIIDVLVGVALFGGAVSAFYVTPVGIVLRLAIGLAVAVFAVLTLWARSRRRMRRSLRNQAQRRLSQDEPRSSP